MSHNRVRARAALVVAAAAALTTLWAGRPAAAGLVTKGNLDVQLLASDLPAGTATTWTNSGTGSTGTFTAGGAVTVADVTDAANKTFKAVVLSGAAGSAFTSANNAPADVVGNNKRSIELWVNNPSIDNVEETMTAWGTRGGPNGTNESFSYGNTYGVGQWGGAPFDITYTTNNVSGQPNTAPAANNWHYLVFTYDQTNGNVYADGVLRDQVTMGANTLNTNAAFPISIGAQNTTTSNASALLGSLAIASVRVESDALTAADVANNYAFGVPGQVPEPSSAALAALAAVGLLPRRFRPRRGDRRRGV